MRTRFMTVFAAVLLVGLNLLMFACEEQKPASQGTAASGQQQSRQPPQQTPPEAESSVSALPQPPAGFTTDVTYRYFYILLDTSGSMSSTIDEAKRAIGTFLKNAPDDVIFAFATFTENGAKERVPFGQDSKREILAALPRIGTGGSTPLGEAIMYSTTRISEQAERQYGDGLFNLLVVTDGAADAGSPMDRAVSELNGAVIYGQTISLYTIGWKLAQGHALSSKSVLYLDAANASELVAALQRATKAESVDLQTLLGQGK